MTRTLLVGVILITGLLNPGNPVLADAGHFGKLHHRPKAAAPKSVSQGKKPVPTPSPEKPLDSPDKVSPARRGTPAESAVVIHEGKVSRFCCNDCPEPFKKSPAVAISRIQDAGKREVRPNFIPRILYHSCVTPHPVLPKVQESSEDVVPSSHVKGRPFPFRD